MWGWLRRLRGERADLVGARSERAAAEFLKGQGYRILGRNLRNRFGEVDLLVEEAVGCTVVVVEVKGGQAGSIRPEVHVNRTKRRKLVALGAQLARQYRFQRRPIRFDIVAVEWTKSGEPILRHHRGAFEAGV